MGGIFESESWTVTMWYKNPLEIILHAFKEDTIQPLEIESPPSTITRTHLEC